jgi:hypothetical protein
VKNLRKLKFSCEKVCEEILNSQSSLLVGYFIINECYCYGISSFVFGQVSSWFKFLFFKIISEWLAIGISVK